MKTYGPGSFELTRPNLTSWIQDLTVGRYSKDAALVRDRIYELVRDLDLLTQKASSEEESRSTDEVNTSLRIEEDERPRTVPIENEEAVSLLYLSCVGCRRYFASVIGALSGVKSAFLKSLVAAATTVLKRVVDARSYLLVEASKRVLQKALRWTKTRSIKEPRERAFSGRWVSSENSLIGLLKKLLLVRLRLSTPWCVS